MKNLKINITLSILAVFAAFVSLTSCSDDDTKVGGQPSIENVSLAYNDSLVDQGYAKNMYIIRGKGFMGTQKIYFNNTDTYFNSTLITDTAIFVTIDENTPYENASDELKVVTPDGTAIYHFIVAPPAPETKSFQPINAADGEQITIYGKFFLDPVVTVDGVQAEVVSNTLTQIVAILPPGSQKKYVQVQTISGKSISNEAVGTAIYDDAFYSPWTFEPWNNHVYITDLAKAYQGTTFIKKEINGWDNIQGNWASDTNIADYDGIRIAIRSDDVGKLIFIFNGQFWGDATKAFATTTDWVEYRFSWADLGGKPEAVQNISFQEFSGAKHNYYFDNIGYYMNDQD